MIDYDETEARKGIDGTIYYKRYSNVNSTPHYIILILILIHLSPCIRTSTRAGSWWRVAYDNPVFIEAVVIYRNTTLYEVIVN